MNNFLPKISRCSFHFVRLQRIRVKCIVGQAILNQSPCVCVRGFSGRSNPSLEAEKSNQRNEADYFRDLAIRLHSSEENEGGEESESRPSSVQQQRSDSTCTPHVNLSCIPKEQLSTQENVEEHWKNTPQNSSNGSFFASVDPLAEEVVHLSDVPTHFPSSFNLAAYVNKSESLQQLVLLGVDISKWDLKTDVCSFILKLDFEKDMKQYIQFLHDNGVAMSDMGNVLSKNPFIFKTPLEDLQVRINYLQSKKFTADAIGRILTKAPFFLTFSTKWIDKRLGYFQKEFQLTGDEVRAVVTRSPKIVVINFRILTEMQFCIKVEMGFQPSEVKHLLLQKPKLWLLDKRSLSERFQFIHNEMGVPHQLILQFPGALLKRKLYVKQRHLFLQALNRAQYDPKKENYVTLKAMVAGSDGDFCRDIAKTSLNKFNDFLKTL